MKIRSKLLLSSSIAIVCLILIGGVGFFSTNNVANISMALYEKQALPVIKINEVEKNAWEILIRLIVHAALSEPDKMRQLEQEIKKRFDSMPLLIEEYAKRVRDQSVNIPETGESSASSPAVSQAFQNEWAQFEQIMKRALELSQDYAKEDAISLLVGEGRAAYDRALTVIRKQVESHEQQMITFRNRATDSRRNAVGWMVVITLTAIALNSVLTIITTRDIQKQVEGVIKIANAIAEGDLPQDIDAEGTDETAQLLSAMKNMVSNLKNTAQIAEQIARGDLTAKVNILSDRDALGKSIALMVSNLKNTVHMAEQIAEGDLTVRVKILSDKDILGKSLALMIERLCEVVSDVREAAESVKSVTDNAKSSADTLASVSLQMSARSEEMARGASDQAASAEEASASMEEMASHIRQNADYAARTEKIALKSSEDAREGGKVVTKTVKAMKAITDRISVIRDIAEQTDILALNATIEAAGAGEYGTRFAIVASEIRDLAERCRTAAGDIDKLSVFSVEVAEKAGNMLSEIVPDIRKTAELVQEISAACNEQSMGAEQISSSFQQLDQVIQQNAQSSEELAGTAEEMASTSDRMLGNSQMMTSQAERLRSAIGHFRMKPDVSPATLQAASETGFLPEEIEKIRAIIARAESDGSVRKKTGSENRKPADDSASHKIRQSETEKKGGDAGDDEFEEF